MGTFFGRIREEIDRGVNVVSARSHEVVESGRIRSRIGAVRKRKQAALEELGSIVYSMMLRGEMTDDRIAAKCEHLQALDVEIREREDDLRRLHIRTRESLGLPAPSGVCECGANLYEEMKYCTTCGRKADTPATPSEGAVSPERACPSCGTKVPSGGTFCPECGRRAENRAA